MRSDVFPPNRGQRSGLILLPCLEGERRRPQGMASGCAWVSWVEALGAAGCAGWGRVRP
jgi:hypothetical protein